MSTYAGEGECMKKPTKGRDVYELKQGLVPTGAEKELFEKKRRPANAELTPAEIEKLKDYAGQLLLVGV